MDKVGIPFDGSRNIEETPRYPQSFLVPVSIPSSDDSTAHNPHSSVLSTQIRNPSSLLAFLHQHLHVPMSLKFPPLIQSYLC